MQKNTEKTKRISIEEFGAKGDGETDSTRAFERAIALALQFTDSYDASSEGISL